MKRLVIAVIVGALLPALTGCADSRECAKGHYVTTVVLVGKAFVPVQVFVCDEYVDSTSDGPTS